MKERPILFNTEMELVEDLGTVSYPTNKQKVHFGIFKCPICHNPFKTRFSTVKNGSTTKCRSCQIVIKNTKHNKTNTRLYNIWARMKYRCQNPNNPAFKWYGAKGVGVCEEWVNGFESFENWALKNGYKPNLVLDKDIICEEKKIYPKMYSPSTCLWVTPSENSKEMNRRNLNEKRKTNTILN